MHLLNVIAWLPWLQGPGQDQAYIVSFFLESSVSGSTSLADDF